MNGLQIIKRSDEKLPYNLLLLADPSREMIDRYLADSSVFLAHTTTHTVGVLVLKIAGHEAEIMNVAVDERLQGKGIGSALIRYAIQKAKEAGLKKLLIGTADTSTSQLKLYQQLGFKQNGRIVNFFVDSYEAPIYENGKQAKDMIRMEMWLT